MMFLRGVEVFRGVSGLAYSNFIRKSQKSFDVCVSDINLEVDHLGELIGAGMLSNKFEVLGASISNMIFALRRCLYDKSLDSDFDPDFALDLLESTLGVHWGLVMNSFNDLYKDVRKDRFFMDVMDALRGSLLDLDRVIRSLIDFLDGIVED